MTKYYQRINSYYSYYYNIIHSISVLVNECFNQTNIEIY